MAWRRRIRAAITSILTKEESFLDALDLKGSGKRVICLSQLGHTGSEGTIQLRQEIEYLSLLFKSIHGILLVCVEWEFQPKGFGCSHYCVIVIRI